MEKETLEEAAENYGWRIKTNSFSDKVKANELAESAKQDFIAGASWQAEQTLERSISLLLKKQEKMYSEEELKSAFKIGFDIGYGSPVSELDLKEEHCTKWFEQLKKK